LNAAPTIEAELRHLEEQLLKHEVRSSPDRLAALLADDFVEFASSGQAFDKKRTIALLREEDPTKRSLSHFQSTVLSEGIVLVTYRGRRNGKADRRAVITLRSSIWRLTNGQWQMVFHQGTPAK
jgi:hypothetical protein